MGFKCGIVGLPNVGKSTLFNALTKMCVASENFPFCTIEPNVGIVPVPDPRLQILADIVKPSKIIPTTMEFIDIAGLVKGAAKGEGLGNQFLANIRISDAIAHVVRCFNDDNVSHVSGRLSPSDDVETINTELLLSDLQTVQKALIKIGKQAKSANKEAIVKKQFLEKVENHLNQSKSARTFGCNSEEEIILKELQLLTAKPILYIANTNEVPKPNDSYVKAINQLAAKENAKVVVICATIESEIAQLSEADKLEFLQDLGLKESGLNRFIYAGYDLLDLQTFFTAGAKEVRAWTIKKNITAPQAAGRIHSDFEKGFIRAEVVAYKDFIQYGGEQGSKEAGKWRLEGKNYIMQEGDVIHFRFNV